MNQMTFPMPAPAPEYFTATELAEIAKARGIKGFPASERGVRLLADRESWNDLPARQARPRATQKAGGRPAMEYHLSILPEIMQQVLAGLSAKRGTQRQYSARRSAELAKLEALQASSLPARARKVMEARSAILTTIEGFSIAHGQRRAWGINSFLDAQKAHQARQEIEVQRDRGQSLTAQEARLLTAPSPLTGREGFHLSLILLTDANDRKNQAEISRTSLYDWFKARDERGVIALAPAATNSQKPIPDWFPGFLKHYALPSKPDAADALNEFLKTLPADRPHPTLSQVRYVLRERLDNIERNIGREGLLTLRSRLAYVTRITEDMWPTTIYSADGKTFDAEIADPVTKRPIRPEITTVIDIVTRKVVGISLSRSENQRSVAEALRNSCSSHGICAIFYVDRGPGYRNEALDADVSGLMGRLGITKMHAAPYGSQAKGRIERPNLTIWDVLAKRLPTYIGADMDKEAGQKVHKITRRELAEFGESRHLPSWEEFVTLCEERVAEYNAKPHRGLPKFRDPATGRERHMSPNECWETHVANGFEPVAIDVNEADDLFRPYEIRTCRRAQVQWNTNFYFHQKLERHHEEEVMVGYDYHQARKVWVREFDRDSGQPGRLICVADFMGNAERYVPLSYEQKALEKRAKGRLRRLERKVETVEAELDMHYLLDHQAPAPADFIDLSPVTPEPAAITVPNVTSISTAAPAKPKRRTFASDEELAAWALEHPEELKPNQIAVLRRCMSNSTARKLFELSGIDTEALRTLLRAVA